MSQVSNLKILETPEKFRMNVDCSQTGRYSQFSTGFIRKIIVIVEQNSDWSQIRVFYKALKFYTYIMKRFKAFRLPKQESFRLSDFNIIKFVSRWKPSLRKETFKVLTSSTNVVCEVTGFKPKWINSKNITVCWYFISTNPHYFSYHKWVEIKQLMNVHTKNYILIHLLFSPSARTLAISSRKTE